MTSNGTVCAWGNNIQGQLGTNTAAVASTNRPMLVTGISHAVMVSAHASSVEEQSGGSHSLAMTMDQGTNRYWAWGDNENGQVGIGPIGSVLNQYAPASVQFCTRCQRCVQLGTSGSFTAQCSGTLVLYFNDSNFTDNSGSYTVTVDGFGQTNVSAFAGAGTGAEGVAVGTVTNGGVYFFSASGKCFWRNDCSTCQADANGATNGVPVDCSSINITNAICPTAKCFSLVGKIQ